MLSTKGLIMWFCAALFYGFQFIVRVSPGVMAEDLMTTLSVDACILGVLASAYYYGYAGMQIPAGILIDRIGVRHPLSVACILCALGCFIFATSTDLSVLTIGRFLMGIGSAFGLLSCIKVSSEWLPPKLLTFFVGMALIIGTTGAVGGTRPLSMLLDAYDWQTVNLILGVISTLIAVLAFSVVRSKPITTQSKDLPKENIFYAIRGILQNPQTWLFGLYGMLMYAPLSGFADLWGVPYLTKLFNTDRTTAAEAIAYFYIGVGIGGPAWSGVLAFFQSYRWTMAVSAVSTGILFIIMIFYPPKSFAITEWLYLFAGFLSSGQFVAFGGVADINLRSRTATASGTHNMLCMISGVILQPLLGYILRLSSGTTADGATGEASYSIDDFRIALLIIPACLITASFIVLFIKEIYKKDVKLVPEIQPA